MEEISAHFPATEPLVVAMVKLPILIFPHLSYVDECPGTIQSRRSTAIYQYPNLSDLAENESRAFLWIFDRIDSATGLSYQAHDP